MSVSGESLHDQLIGLASAVAGLKEKIEAIEKRQAAASEVIQAAKVVQDGITASLNATVEALKVKFGIK